MKTTNKETLVQVVRHLMLHSSYTPDLGLLNGKIGIILFFYEYASYTNNRLYRDFADDLLDEIFEELATNLPIGFADGLCGIAWGIEYLMRKGFVEADADEVLEELDQQIAERDVRKMTDYSLKTGLKGVAYYVLSRYHHRQGEHPIINYTYINDLADRLGKESQVDKERDQVIEHLRNLPSTTERNTNLPLLDNLIDGITYRKGDLLKKPRPDGILQNGYTGIGLKLLKELRNGA
jgi:hypothetical protein